MARTLLTCRSHPSHHNWWIVLDPTLWLAFWFLTGFQGFLSFFLIFALAGCSVNLMCIVGSEESTEKVAVQPILVDKGSESTDSYVGSETERIFFSFKRFFLTWAPRKPPFCCAPRAPRWAYMARLDFRQIAVDRADNVWHQESGKSFPHVPT